MLSSRHGTCAPKVRRPKWCRRSLVLTCSKAQGTEAILPSWPSSADRGTTGSRGPCLRGGRHEAGHEGCVQDHVQSVLDGCSRGLAAPLLAPQQHQGGPVRAGPVVRRPMPKPACTQRVSWCNTARPGPASQGNLLSRPGGPEQTCQAAQPCGDEHGRWGAAISGWLQDRGSCAMGSCEPGSYIQPDQRQSGQQGGVVQAVSMHL